MKKYRSIVLFLIALCCFSFASAEENATLQAGVRLTEAQVIPIEQYGIEHQLTVTNENDWFLKLIPDKAGVYTIRMTHVADGNSEFTVADSNGNSRHPGWPPDAKSYEEKLTAMRNRATIEEDFVWRTRPNLSKQP